MNATDLNRDYYESESGGRQDYWRLMAAPRRRVEVILREIGSLTPARSLVDLGCGNGALLTEIARLFPGLRLAGLDLSEPQIKANQKRLPQIEWLTADLTGVDDAAAFRGQFDLVVATEVIEHLDHPERLMTNAARLCSPGGHLILSTQSGRIGETERRVGHVRHFSAGDLERLLIAHGWSPKRIWNEGFPFHDLSKWLANRNPDLMMKSFGERDYGPLQKLTSAGLRAAFKLNSGKRGAQLFATAQLPGG